MKRVVYVVFLVVLLAIGTFGGQISSAARDNMPAIGTQVSSVESGEFVTATAVRTGSFRPCSSDLFGDGSTSLVYITERFDQATGNYIEARRDTVRLPFGQRRVPVLVMFGLVDGEYRLTSTCDGSFLEALPFTVGPRATRVWTEPMKVGVPDPGPHYGLPALPERKYADSARLPYLSASSIVRNGAFVVNGELRTSGTLQGYILQDFADKTVVLPAEFRWDGDHVSVEVGEVGDALDPSRAVRWCATADGGGATTCGVLYDPANPFRELNPFASPFGRSR